MHVIIALLGIVIQSGPGTPQVHYGKPPAALGRTATSDKIELLGGHYTRGSVSHDLDRKTVSIEYFAYQGGTPDSGSLVESSISVNVPFWPTAAAVLDDSHVAVAGKEGSARGWNTVIEIWTLRVPFVAFNNNPAVGPVGPVLRNTGVLSKAAVFAEAVVGKDMVKGLVRLRGKPASVLVHFHDSGDLYELEFAQLLDPDPDPPQVLYPITKLFRATPGTDVPFLPELASPGRDWWLGATHASQGYVYFYWPSLDRQIFNPAHSLPALNLYDRDRDGVIEAWGTPTALENEASGLLTRSDYEEFGLMTVQ